MPPSEDEVSLGDDEFVVPEDPVEQERFKHRLIATINSLKKKQHQLQADQDLLTDRWTEVLAAEEYGFECQTADRPPRGQDKTGYQPEYQPAPPCQYTTARGNRQDLQDILENKAGSQDRSTDHGGAPQCVTMITTPDTLNTNPAGPNTTDQTQLNCIVM